MATTFEAVPNRPVARINVKERPTSTLAFDGLMSLLAVWFMVGLFLDGAAHARNSVESFFTPWHAILYSGYLANALAVFWATFRNIGKGYSRWLAIPAGYEMTIIGAVIFEIGGIFDLIWHTVFGIEVNVEALISPSHLVLALGLMLIVNGTLPCSMATRRSAAVTHPGLDADAVIALLYTVRVDFFHLHDAPFLPGMGRKNHGRWASRRCDSRTGLATHPVTIRIFDGLLAARNPALEVALWNRHICANAEQPALSVIGDGIRFVPVAFAAGVFADVLILVLKPSIKRPVMFRVFAFTVPLVLYLLYFAEVSTINGLAWSVPLWGGASTLAGAVGLLISYLLIPSPAMQIETAAR